MNTRNLIAATTFAIFAGAAAAAPTQFNDTPSTASRAAVSAEAGAQNAGHDSHFRANDAWGSGAMVGAKTSEKSRAEVVAEVKAQRQAVKGTQLLGNEAYSGISVGQSSMNSMAGGE